MLFYRGNLSATHVRLENAAHPVKYQGVVCSLKDGYGAIERADVVKEIFFHEQDVNCGLDLKPGDDVEFNIQMKHVSSISADAPNDNIDLKTTNYVLCSLG